MYGSGKYIIVTIKKNIYITYLRFEALTNMIL